MAGFVGTSRRWLIYPALFLALLAVDTATKIGNSTPDWGWHHVPGAGWSWLGILFLFGLALWAPIRIAAIFALAGAVGNSLWSYSAGGVPNPWVAEPDGHLDLADFYLLMQWSPETVAFNSADVFVWIGQMGLIVSACFWSQRVLRRAWKQRAYTQPARRARYRLSD